MKKFIDYINESDQRWVAIEVTTEGPFSDSKPVTSQRVVTLDTYNELEDKGRTKGGYQILRLSKLCSPTKDKDYAMTYLDKGGAKTPRKSKIDKKGADYIVYAITLGKLAPGGSTNFSYNLWEEFGDDKTAIYALSKGGIYVTNGRRPFGAYFLVGAKDSLDIGDTFVIADNDSRKLMGGGGQFRVTAILPSDKEGFIEGYRKEFPDYCKKPSVSFGRQLDGIPWKDFSQIYAIKGVAKE